MKRTIAGVWIVVLAIAVSASAAPLLSDVNADGRVNVLDLLKVRNSLGNDPAQGPEGSERADINGDAKINVLDMLGVRNDLGSDGPSAVDNSPATLTGLDDATGLSEPPVAVSLAADYFPLQVGNYWKYEKRWGSNVLEEYKVEVLRRAYSYHYFTFYWLAGYFPHTPPEQRLVCRTYSNNVFEWSRNSYWLNLWYKLGSAVGTRWRFVLEGGNPCNSPLLATLASRTETVTVPAGTFANCVKVVYSEHGCADAGMTAEWFAPGVGLVKREDTSIAGPMETVLVEARVDGHIHPRDRLLAGLGVIVKSDAPVYTNNLMPPVVALPVLEAGLVVFNFGEHPVTFHFTSSQRFDFVIRNSDGKEMYRWSDGRGFLTVMGSETLNNDMLKYNVRIPLDLGNLEHYPDGLYTLEGILTSYDKPMKGTVTFQVRSVH